MVNNEKCNLSYFLKQNVISDLFFILSSFEKKIVFFVDSKMRVLFLNRQF